MKGCFDPMDKIGTSNVASGPIRLTMDRPAMLIMVPRKRLEEVIRVLLQPPKLEKWNWNALRNLINILYQVFLLND
ncbi:MAG: hypothetical protein CML41_04245 [Rhodobacteraceae bacterium]|nr:hypothetical protein [Paracoccaceae bacterium]